MRGYRERGSLSLRPSGFVPGPYNGRSDAGEAHKRNLINVCTLAGGGFRKGKMAGAVVGLMGVAPANAGLGPRASQAIRVVCGAKRESREGLLLW